MNRSKNGTILVVGGGVSGLTSALCLRRRGFNATIVAEAYAPRVTSVVAGALWEWPPAVCGYHQDQISLARSKDWSMTSLKVFAELAGDRNTGVFLRPVTFYSKKPVDDDPVQLVKVNEIRDKLDGFVHDRSLIAAHGVNPEFGVRDAYSHIAPMIDTDVYMKWLMNQVRDAGCRVETEKISGELRDRERELLDRFHADAIVNCSGLGAKELANDRMFPLRGALVRVRNDGRAMPRITQAHCVSHDDESDEQDIVFIVPRGDDMLVLGGLAEPREWRLDIDMDSYQPIRDMYNRCIDFLPILKRAEIDAAEPTRVGLRPFRPAHVRLEREPGARIVHNYGHGGSGVTYSWGCAREVERLVSAL